MPDRADCAEALKRLATDVMDAEATGMVRVEVESDFRPYQVLFDK